MSIINFKLTYTWCLWYHELSSNDWTIESYKKIMDINDYNDKDMIDKNLQEPYGDDDNDDDDDQDANEDGLDIDQSSQEGDEQIPAEKPHQT